MNKNITKTFKETFNITVPEGILYYPCCGADTLEPILLFHDSINEFHFSDINRVVLPKLECDTIKPCNSYFQENTLKLNNEFIPSELVKSVTKKSSIIKFNVGDYIKQISHCDMGDILIRENETRQIWMKNDDHQLYVFTHEVDGFLKLTGLDKISVFYYRGDSIGEGGSSQWWFGTDIFNLLTQKLVPGAIILTDGSNPSPSNLNIPWCPLFNSLVKDLKDLNFKYHGRSFNYIGVCDYRRNNTRAWQVE